MEYYSSVLVPCKSEVGPVPILLPWHPGILETLEARGCVGVLALVDSVPAAAVAAGESMLPSPGPEPELGPEPVVHELAPELAPELELELELVPGHVPGLGLGLEPVAVRVVGPVMAELAEVAVLIGVFVH